MELIDQGGGAHLEFKSSVRHNFKTEKNGKEIEFAWLKALVAFLNSTGGTLLIGVADDGTIVGIEHDNFKNEDRCLLHVKNLFNQYIGADLSPLAGFNCNQCGHCCLNLSGAINVCAIENDIRRWQENDRTDILAWVDVISLGEGHQVYDIWINPTTGDDAVRCPWLRKLPGENKYICRIQDMKPEHCRNYPLSREHAEETGCPGFDN